MLETQDLFLIYMKHMWHTVSQFPYIQGYRGAGIEMKANMQVEPRCSKIACFSTTLTSLLRMSGFNKNWFEPMDYDIDVLSKLK